MNDEELLALGCSRNALLALALEGALDYFDTLDGRSVEATADAVEALRSGLPTAWPEAGMDDTQVLGLLRDLGGPATVACAGRRYFGFVTGGSLPVSLAANWLACAWDQNSFSLTSSPVATVIEEQASAWVLEALGLPGGSATAFVTGATMANVCGLLAARHALLERQGWDVEAKGLLGAPLLRVIVGEDAHPALLKALGFIGLGRERVEPVAVNSQGAIRPDALPELDETCIVCAQAGNVNSGAFDPLALLGEAAQASGAWLHVDGAFGIWVRASEKLAHLARGAELAHSIATDAHKWLNVPYDCGIATVREPAALQGAMTIGAPYLPLYQSREPLHFTPETSRRARGVEVWSALASLGRQGLAGLIERNCELAGRMARRLRDAGLQVLNEVNLNQVLIGFEDEARTARVVRAVQQEGTCWCGPTRWRGQGAMRISVSSWATTGADIERSADAIIKVSRQTN